MACLTSEELLVLPQAAALTMRPQKGAKGEWVWPLGMTEMSGTGLAALRGREPWRVTDMQGAASLCKVLRSSQVQHVSLTAERACRASVGCGGTAGRYSQQAVIIWSSQVWHAVLAILVLEL